MLDPEMEPRLAGAVTTTRATATKAIIAFHEYKHDSPNSILKARLHTLYLND